jgi:hypothetical protein
MTLDQGPRFQPGDKVTPTKPEASYEREAGTVYFLGDNGYLVRYPVGYWQMHGWRELRPARPAEFVRYRQGVAEVLPAGAPDYPRWDGAREVWTRPLTTQTTLRQPSTGYTVTVLVAGDEVTATYHDRHGDETCAEDVVDDDPSMSAAEVARERVAQLQQDGWQVTTTHNNRHPTRTRCPACGLR